MNAQTVFKRGPSIVLRKERHDDRLIAELQGREHEYPVNLDIGYKRIIKNDFGGAVEAVRQEEKP